MLLPIEVSCARQSEFPDLIPGTKWFLVYGKK
jgi:hypothetical protein